MEKVKELKIYMLIKMRRLFNRKQIRLDNTMIKKEKEGKKVKRMTICNYQIQI